MYHPNGRDAGLRRVNAVTGGVAVLALVGTGVAGVSAFRHDQAVAVASSTVTSNQGTTTTPASGSSATSSSSGLSVPSTPVTQAPTTSAPVAKSSGS